MLFAGETYYPLGGFEDFTGSFDTLEEAHAWVARVRGIDWAHVVHKDAIVNLYARRSGWRLP
jgi:hypothetical protein